MPSVAHHDLGACAVVGGEKNQRIIEGVHRLELPDDPADFLVHSVDHGCVDRHLRCLKPALLRGELCPRQWSVDLSCAEFLDRLGKRVWRTNLLFQLGQGGVGNSKFLLRRVAFGAHRFPAAQVTVPVFRDVLRQRVQREVRGDECHVVEERLFRVVDGVIFQTIDRVVGDSLGCIVAGLVRWRSDRHVIQCVSECSEIISLIFHVEGSVKSPRKHLPINMPFPAVITAVPGRLQKVWEKTSPGLPRALSASGKVREGVTVDLLRVVPAQKGAAAWPAPGGVVKFCEPESVCRQAIQMRRGNFPSIAAKVRVAEVIGHDEDDVGLWGCGTVGAGQQCDECESAECGESHNLFD